MQLSGGILRHVSTSARIVGRTSDAINFADALEQLEKYDCAVPSIDVATPEPGTETHPSESDKEITG